MQTPHVGRLGEGPNSPLGPGLFPFTFREFLMGVPAYRPIDAPMQPWIAAMATAAIVISAQFLAVGLYLLPSLLEHVMAVQPAASVGQSNDIMAKLEWNPTSGRLMGLTLLSQIIVVIMTLIAARHRDLSTTLRLGPPAPNNGWRLYVFAIAAMLPVLGLINGFSYLVAPKELFTDFKFFNDIARGDQFVTTALAIGVGAPLSEELLFRGFLLTALSATALGYVRAAILATLAWTALHFAYSWVGLTEVACIGLYFSWLLWRTGSLWPALFCHALYNSSLLVALRYWPA